MYRTQGRISIRLWGFRGFLRGCWGPGRGWAGSLEGLGALEVGGPREVEGKEQTSVRSSDLLCEALQGLLRHYEAPFGRFEII